VNLSKSNGSNPTANPPDSDWKGRVWNSIRRSGANGKPVYRWWLFTVEPGSPT